MTHDVDSPSSLMRRRKCPGSRRMEAAHPGGSSAAAIDGTHTHSLVAYCLENDKVPDELLGEEMEDHEGVFTIEQDRADRAFIMVDYVLSRMEALKAQGQNPTLHIEVDVDPAPAFKRTGGVAGTSDTVILWDEGIEVIDYKDGFILVEVVNNDQLRSYLTGALIDVLPEGQVIPTTLMTTIVQPRALDQGAKAINHETVTMKEWQFWCDTVSDDLNACDAPDAPLVPGEHQCRFCDAGGVCSARASMALDGVTFPVVVPAASTLDEKAGALQALASFDAESMSDEQLVLFLQGIPIARDLFKAVEKYAKQQVEQGRTLEGFKLVKTFGNTAWCEIEEVVAKRLAGRGMKVAEIYARKLKSPTQILKSKSLNEKQQQYVKDKLTARKETGTKLVHVTEGGIDALPRAPEGMFAPVQPEVPAFLVPPSTMRGSE